MFMNLANLNGIRYDTTVADEALKCMVNIGVKVKPAVAKMLDKNLAAKLVDVVKVMTIVMED
jgi:hypothetical protein